MKIIIIDTYYPIFLKSFYEKYPLVKVMSYSKHKNILMKETFGTSDFYSKAFSKLGHPTEDIILNNEYLQKKWEEENSKISISFTSKLLDTVVGEIPYVKTRISSNWELKVLYEQINKFKPDVIYSHNLGYIDPDFLFSIKNKVKLIVGQIASPLPFLRNLKPYDLIITSFPHYVKTFKKMGINSEYIQLCFEPSILKRIPKQKRIYDVTFIGGISRAHKKGFKLLNDLAERIKIDVWGYGKENLNPHSKLFQYHHGEAWGKDMYKLMLRSKITVNRHIDVAKNYANNMRLYEATGCGAMLITDTKDNLNQIFEIGKEVVSYTSVDDLVAKIRYYLKHEDKSRSIAKEGQKRTLSDHNYTARMKETINIIKEYL